jgi:hypothetical protein
VGLERGLLSVVSTVEELLGRNSSVFGLENENSAARILRADHATPFICKRLAPTSPTTGDRSVGIVRSRTKAAVIIIIITIIIMPVVQLVENRLFGLIYINNIYNYI